MTSAAEKKAPKIKVEPISDTTPHAMDIDSLQVPGHDLKFGWYTHDQIASKGFKFWNPVKRDTELGEYVESVFNPHHVRYEGINQDTSFFHRGHDSILVYTTRERWEQHLASDEAAADRQFSSLGEGAKASRFSVHTQGLKK